ncbi:MAG: S8 family serine peptidase [Planctomycetota bacterium]
MTKKSRNGSTPELLESRIVLSATYVQNHVLLTFNHGSTFSSEQLAATVPGSKTTPLGSYGVSLMKLAPDTSVETAINALRAKPGIRSAEPDWIGQWTALPNDPSFNQQWGLRNFGQNVNGTNGTPDADIDANQAWDRTTGSSSVIAAIVDSGMDYLHPDLAGNMWLNSSEVAGNGIDDDNNGYIDDTNGFDFASGDADPMDFVGHGTHVGGIVGAVGDNGVGVSGVNWDVSLMALKIGTDFGGPTTSGAIEAINYAVSMGAAVSNHSYGVTPSQALEDAIINAQANNHIVVVAAGNSSSNNDAFPAYPASYPQDNIIAVAATDSRDRLASFSSYGATSVDIGAPGVDIFSTVPTAGSVFYPTPNYEYSDGTSMASPMVAGAVALLRSISPSSSYTTIIDAIYQGADPLPALAGRVSTGARLNVNNALNFLQVAAISISPASVAENAGANAATITIQKTSFPVNQALTLDLLVSDTSEAIIPALAGNPTFTIPAGQTQITFAVDAVDDSLLDGTQTVIFDLQQMGASISTASLEVTDHETVSVVAIPNVVSENAGPNAGVLQVSRSNTDVFTLPRVASVNNELRFFDQSGAQVGASVTVPWPTGARPGGEDVRDIATMEDGRIAVFNGTSQVYVSLYTPSTDAWTHRLISGASASAADSGTGGISTIGNFVFLSDLETSAGDQYGLIRVDVISGVITRFGTKSFGNRLFASSWPESTIYELNPLTGAILRSISTPAAGGGNAGLAFDGTFIWYIVSASDTLYKIDADTGSVVDTFAVGSPTNSGFDGLAVMNGYIYLLDPFLTDQIVVFDPVLRRTVSTLLIGALNNLDLSGGLAPNPARNSLFVTSTFSDTIYEVSATTGYVLTRPGGTQRTFASGEYWDAGLATVGSTLYMGAQSGSTSSIRIFNLDGVFQSTIPWTNTFGIYALGGDGIQGLVDTPYRYRDTIVGLDGSIYALESGGLIVARFDSNTLSPVSFLTLSERVESLAIDGLGNLFGGTSAGDVVEFDSTGAVIKRLSLGIGLISDLDINVSGDILAGSAGGACAGTTTALLTSTVYSSGSATTVFMAFGEHVSKNRGELVVTISNSDVTELSTPITVVIPEGQQTVTVPFGAVDDNFRDGAQDVTVGASALGYVPNDTIVTVNDFEEIAVDVEATSMAESDGPAATRVRVYRTDEAGPYTYTDTQSFTNTALSYLLDAGTITSVISVPSQISWLTDVDVTINLSHTNMPDLDVFLISPKGTRVELFTDLNTNSRNMINTILDDQANTSILNGTGTFTGRFMPEKELMKVFREEIEGDWTLEITDDNVSHFGQLNSWALTFKTEGLEPTVVTLTGDDLTEAGFGGSNSVQVLIPANQSSVYVNLDAIDDTELDGTQTVVISASAVTTQGLLLGSDTIDVTDDEKLTLSLSRTTVSEAAGPAALTGTLTRFNTDISLPFTVQLSSSDTSELTVPPSVTIPANQNSVTFDIAAIDDNLIDGTQQVTITASAPAYGPDLTAIVSVEDLEPSLLLTSDNSTVREDAGTIEVKVKRVDQADMSQPMIVTLSSANVPAGGAQTISVPANVVIPANQPEAIFIVTIIDDNLLDGTQVGRITASSSSIIPGTIDINVTDFETVTVTIDRNEFLENAGSKAAVGTVRRSNTNIALPLVVTLQSSDTSELTVPASVTIPAGKSSVTFDIAAVNDPDLDGPQTVQISASASGYFGVSGTVTVLDHEPPVVTGPASKTVNPLPTITWNPIPGAIRYDVQVANLSSGASFLIYQTVSGTSLTPVEKLGIGRYRVWVRAVDALERPGFWSAPRDFNVETAPTITAPTLNGTVASTSFPEISWTAVVDATRYELWVNNLTTGRTRVIGRTNLVTTNYKATEKLGSGTYTAFVRAFNSSSEFGQWSAGHTFTVLASPSMITPSTGGTFDRTPTFSWTPIEGAKTYDIWVTSRTTNVVAIRNQSVSSASFTPARDMAVGDYTVWVRAQSGQYFSPWSAARQFSIGMPPVINSPTNNSSGDPRPTFLWSSISETERYELWVNNDTTKTRVIYLTNLTSTSYRPAANLAAGNYRVWVRAVSLMGETTAWSTPVSFTVAQSSLQPADSLKNDSGAILTSLLPQFESKTEVKLEKNSGFSATPVTQTEQMPVRTSAPPVIGEKVVLVADDADVMAVDSVMESWDASDWWGPMVIDHQKVTKASIRNSR